MKLTNTYDLPNALVKALSGFEADYLKGRKDTDISVTQLIFPPIIKKLYDLHGDEVEEDISERLWILLGSSIHKVLEHSATSNSLVEERLFIEVDGWKLSGQADLYEADGTLSDYKITSVYSVINDPKPEWEQQLNVLAYLYEQAVFEVKKLQIVAILRDWTQGKFLQNSDFGEIPIKIIPIPKWDKEKTLSFISERISLHALAQKTEDINKIPYCSAAERWARPTKWALCKKNRKSAVKLFDTFEECEQAVIENGKDYFWEIRQGEDVRCDRYCSVNKFCPYYNNKNKGELK